MSHQTPEGRVVVVPTDDEREAERRFLYGGFRDRDVRLLLQLRAKQLAAFQANMEERLTP